MSSNIQDSSPRKRSHDDFVEENHAKMTAHNTTTLSDAQSMAGSLLPTPAHIVDELSPMGSPALTEGGCSTPARNSPSPQTPSKLSTVHSASSVQTVPADGAKSQAATAGPAPKRKRLTAEEKEQRDKEQAEKKQEREEKLRLKAEEKAQQEKEKAERAAERAAEKEEKRKKKEQEEKLRAQQRDEKKRQKDEEDRKKREAEEKKARSQPSLTSFFGAPRVPKKTEPTTTSALAPTPAELPTAPELQTTQIEYAKMFKPFYLKENARMAQAPFTMDDETREAKSKILDEYMCGQRKYEHETVFDSVKSFDLVQKPGRRGRLHPPVRQIMETTYKEMEAAGTSGGHEADKLMQETRRKLAKIPVKVIAFSRDVRPPYYGTATAKPHLAGGEKLRALARRPTSRTLELDYDYDSEAEWQEEEGEDVDIDDEEEELDDEDDLDGFLDDSEDVGLARRIFANTMEPESTGVCFEGGAESSMTQTLYDHRMEYIHQSLGSQSAIDPWSTSYWEPEPKKAVVKPVAQIEKAAAMLPPPTPANAFAALTKAGPPASGPTKIVKDDILDDIKKAILDNKLLSKVGIVDYVYQQFREKTTRTEVKNTIELVAEKKGTGRVKEWELRPGFELKTQ